MILAYFPKYVGISPHCHVHPYTEVLGSETVIASFGDALLSSKVEIAEINILDSICSQLH